MIRVLGPIQIVTPGGRAIDLPSASQRRLLAVLAMHAPGWVRAEWLAEVLRVSPSGMRTGVSRLRTALDGGALVAVAGGYQLRSDVDAQQFSRAVAAVPADRRLAGLEAALGLWGGSPFDEFADEDWAVGEVARLVELHAGATDDCAAELVTARRWSGAIAVLYDQVARHPLRDRSRGLLIRALSGAGRQADALRAYQDYRALLADDVGTEPSSEVRVIARRVAEGWNGGAAEPRSGGDQEPRPVHRPVPTAFPASLAAARDGPFAGRADLVAELCTGWRTRRWHTLLMAGEPGIGKSRLLGELAHRMHAEGSPVSVGRCDEDVAMSHGPWTELLEPLATSLSGPQRSALGPGHLDELSRILPALPSTRGAPAVGFPLAVDARQTLLADAIIALLRVVGPAVLVLDDIQWIDPPSLRVLRRIARAALPELTVLGAYRDTDLARSGPPAAVLADLTQVPGVRRVAVEGIDDAAVVALVRAGLGRDLDAAEVSRARAIHALTAGNPLFVLELIARFAHHDTAGLPVGLVELIEHRLSRLGGETVEVLRVAAAVGSRFDVDVVEQTGQLRSAALAEPPTDVVAALELARDAGVIIDDGRETRFRHAVIRGALLAGMSTGRRRHLHRDIATVLERGTARPGGRRLAELAHHHDRAAGADAPRWYLRAAAAAVEAFDTSATGLADRGLELLAGADETDPALRCDLLIARTAGLHLTGAQTLADARRATDAAVALGDQERIARALLAPGVPSLIDRDVADYVAFLADGLARLTDPYRVSRWNVAMELALCRARNPSADAAEHRRTILEMVAHLDPADPVACRIALRGAWSLTGLNLARDALAITERFAPGCRGVDSTGWPVEPGLSTMWLHLADRAASDRYLGVARSDPLRRYRDFDCHVRRCLAMRHLLDGRWADAAAEIAQVRSRAADDPALLLACEAQESWLRRDTGDVHANFEAASAAVTVWPDLLVPHAWLAAHAAEAGRPDVARAQLDRLTAEGYAGAGSRWMTVMAAGELAWAAIAVDAREHAAPLRALLAGYRGQLAVIGDDLYVMCAIDRLLAGLADLAGDHDEADRLFAAALEQEGAVRSAPLQARTRHWWGRALLRRGDHSRARPLLAQAEDSARILAMVGLTAQIGAVVGRG